MVKKIDILGMEIDNYTVREAMIQVEGYLNQTGMSMIETVSMKMLDMAGEESCVKECIRLLDLAVIGEKEILVAAGFRSNQRTKEIVEHEFFREFLKRIVRNRKQVFLLGEQSEDVDKLEDYLREEYEKILIGGRCSLDEKSGDIEGVVNEVNGVSPDVVLSILPSPVQENFLLGNKGKLDAKIWYGIGDDYEAHSGIRRLSRIAGRMIHKKRLQSQLHKYQNENEAK